MQLTQTQKIFSVLTARQWRILSALSMAVTLMMVTTGCNPAWISEAQGIVTTVVTIIGSITSILGLFGAAVSPTVIADINQGAEDVNAELSTVGPLITQYEATPSTGILSSIVNALTLAQTKLTALLTGVQITNAALQTKIGEVITLALNALKEGLALIPAPNASKAQLEEHRIKAAVFFESSPAKKLKQAYNTILATPTHDAEVDAVFAKVKHL